jgi:hypothetical protein
VAQDAAPSQSELQRSDFLRRTIALPFPAMGFSKARATLISPECRGVGQIPVAQEKDPRKEKTPYMGMLENALRTKRDRFIVRRT